MMLSILLLLALSNPLQASNLEEKFNKLETEFKDLKVKVQYLEKLQRVPGSCEELYQLGIEESGYYMIDFDGLDKGDPPVNAYCQFPQLQTSIGEPLTNQTNECHGDRCFSFIEASYEFPNQLQALWEQSEECHQTFSIGKPDFSLEDKALVSWQGRNGEGGMIMDQEFTGELHIAVKEKLPMKGVAFGPWTTNTSSPEVKLTIHPMICSKRKVGGSSSLGRISGMVETCMDHKDQGDPPGYYIVKKG